MQLKKAGVVYCHGEPQNFLLLLSDDVPAETLTVELSLPIDIDFRSVFTLPEMALFKCVFFREYCFLILTTVFASRKLPHHFLFVGSSCFSESFSVAHYVIPRKLSIFTHHALGNYEWLAMLIKNHKTETMNANYIANEVIPMKDVAQTTEP